MSGRTETCDDCGTQTRDHKFVAGQHICTFCYAERDELARQGDGLAWVERKHRPSAPVWAAYHLACAEVGYSLRATTDRKVRDRINARWSAYMYAGAVLRDEDAMYQHGRWCPFEGPEWEKAREWAEGLPEHTRQALGGGK